MSAPFEDIEARLRAALAPVEPPAHLQQRLEATLNEIVELAAEELEAFELSAIKDPRNWPRAIAPATAAVVGTGAAVGLVVLRTHRRRSQNVRLPIRALREARKAYRQLAPDR
jgi:hypothetical protein